MKIENKGEKAFQLRFEDSPKILISTNYTIKGKGASFEDRKFEVEFSDHYNENYKPKDDFGHIFFDEWDNDEWNRFDNFMLECVELYLKEGLVEYQQINLEMRKLLDNTSPEFVEFAEQNILTGTKYNKKMLFDDFILDYGSPKWLTPKRFTSWINEYGKYHNYEVSHTKSNGNNIVELNEKFTLFD